MATVTTQFGADLLRRGITSDDFARMTGYSTSTVRSWRSGSRTPSRGATVVIAAALNLSPRTGPDRVLRMIRSPAPNN